MRLERQGWIVVALGVVFVVASFLPWLGHDSAWSLRFAPLVVVVHIPVVIAILWTTLLATDVIQVQPPVLDDRQWLQVTACYGLVGSVSGLLLQRSLLTQFNLSSEYTATGAGALLTIAAAIGLFVVVFFGERIAFLREPSAATASVSGSTESRWISLGAPYSSPDGQVLQPDEWYLAFDEDGAVIVQLDNGTEIELPRGFPIGEAP